MISLLGLHNAARAFCKSWLPVLLIGVLSLGISACKNDTSDETSADGQLYLGLTDAKGDFLHYAVDVKQIRLQKANGAAVNVLPATTRVDFAEYTNMTEFLTAAMVPSGIYTRAQLLLDYTNADIWVEADNGQAQKVSAIYDGDGMAVTEMLATVHLEGINRVVIAAGTPVHLTLDFDLNASNQVTFDATSGDASVVVEPLLSAELSLNRFKAHRVRGPLLSVDESNDTFRVILRPFFHAMTSDTRFGSLPVSVDSATVFDVNGGDYQGHDGIVAMNQLTQYSAVVVRGDIKSNPLRFVASMVFAGSSVPGGSSDVVVGHVISRSDNVVNIMGPTLIRAGGTVEFGQTVAVTLSVDTQVKKFARIDTLDISAISVGQRIAVFGNVSGDADSGYSMDATNGAARLFVTNLRGSVVTLPASAQDYLALDLQYIDRRSVNVFDFSGTGSSLADDAQAGHYEVGVNGLNLGGIGDNAPVRVMGFVHAFADAPADFEAISVTDLSELPAGMAISWENGSASPFTSSTNNVITLDLTGQGRFHHFSQAGIRIDMNDMTIAPSLVSGPLGVGVFVIASGEQREVYLSFSAWLDAIQSRLGSGAALKGIKAVGQLDILNVELTVRGAKAIF